MRHKSKNITLIFIVICTTVVFLSFFLNSQAKAQVCEDIFHRIKQGQAWIINAQQDDGLFTYEYLPLEDKVTDDNNIVRQVGTFWVLVETLGLYRDDKTLKTIKKFREKISTMIIHAKSGDEDIAYIDFGDLGKINTSALYVLAMVSLKNFGIELTEQEEKDLPLFIKGMREMSDEKGGFWYLYFLPEDHNLITAYGSGEALFALAKYYNSINDMTSLEWTYKAFMQYFDRFLKDEDDFHITEARAFFSWGIYALEIINQKFPIEYSKTVKHMLDMAFRKREENPNCKDKGCILSPGIGGAPFTEGIVQAYKMALQHETNAEEIKKIQDYLTLAIAQYSDLQVIDIDKFRKNYNFTGKPENVLGAFCSEIKCEKLRNDLTQHAVSAFMYYSKQFCTAEEQGSKLIN